MEQSKFYRTLYKLNEKERQRFLDFISSPYYNKNREIIQLTHMLLLEATPPAPKEEIYKTLYPDNEFDEKAIANLLQLGMRLLLNYLAVEQYGGQEWAHKLNLLAYIRERELAELHKGVVRDIDELRESKPLRDSEYFYEEYLYHTEADKIFLNRAKIDADESLQKKVDQLDLFYLSARLRDSCEMMNRTNILSIHYEFRMLDKLLEAVEQGWDYYRQYPAIAIFFNILMMLKEPDELKHFTLVKEGIHAHIHQFHEDEQRSLYGYLQNYCIRKVNSGSTEFYREILDTYLHMLQIGLMKKGNKNLQWDMKNMVSVGLRLKEYDLIYGLINELKPKLPEAIRDNAYTYNLANYYFETKDFKKAIKLLNSVEFTDVYYSLDAKVMLLKIYFAQEEEEAFYALIAAFKVYLLRNKRISKDIALTYHNLLKYTRKAFVFKTQPAYLQKRSHSRIQALKASVQQTRQMVNQLWLLKELDIIGGEV